MPGATRKLKPRREQTQVSGDETYRERFETELRAQLNGIMAR